MEEKAIRDTQEQAFLRDHEDRLMYVAKAYQWNQKGFELKEWGRHLLPDGYECPPDETYDELSNALRYLEGEISA